MPWAVALAALQAVFLAKALDGKGSVILAALQAARPYSPVPRAVPWAVALAALQAVFLAKALGGKGSVILAALQAAEPYSPVPRAVPLRCVQLQTYGLFF